MTQVTSPWHARAFQLRAAARYAAVGVTGPKTAAGRAPFIDWSDDWETAWDAVGRP